jgi:DNA-binding SARP family transcriptional activator
MEFGILGPIEIRVDGRPVPLGGPKQRALFAMLLLRRGQVVPVERLIDDLWGALPPSTARDLLWVHVARLRKALEPGRAKGVPSSLLVTHVHGYRLNIEPDDLDLDRFERLVAEGREALASGAAEEAGLLLRQALDLWRGPPLADLAAEPFARGHVVRLEERRVSALEDRIDADLAAGRHQDLSGELEALIAANPLRERLRGQLMVALYRAGRQGDALEVYRRTRHYLAEEVGIDPGAELQRLERAILTQDPRLERAPLAGRQTPGGQATPTPNDVAVAPIAPPTELRKTVTFTSIGISASKAGQHVDPESLHHLASRYLDEVRSTLHDHGGTVQRLTGESVTAIFGVPAAHENDALRAVRSAIGVRSLLDRASASLELDRGVRLSVSIGIETSEVMLFEPGGETALAGTAPRAAVALEQMASASEILLGPVTCGLVRDAVEVEQVEDSHGAVRSAWRLIKVTPGVPGHARRLDAPLVGREPERAMLTQVFERVIRQGACHLVTVMGPAGIGKSRLVEEVIADLGGGARVLRGRCPDYGEGITFWPLVEAMRLALPGCSSAEEIRMAIAALLHGERNVEAVAEQVAGMLGAGEAVGAPQELPWAIRRTLEALARRAPIVLVLDDLQWAEPPLLDLLEHITDLARGAAILLCCIARPELYDVRAGWGGGKPNATSILLEPLRDAECRELVGNLLGPVNLSAAVTHRFYEVTEGNPLFLEELVGMLIDDGVLVHSSGAWTAATDVTALPVPPTVSALLAARLDQLDPEERAVLGRASVIGRAFQLDAVVELSPDPERSKVAGRMLSLTRKELIRPDGSAADGGERYRFRHLLIRDAAYVVLSKRQRIELHERFAIWLETIGAPAGETDDLIAYHLEQACLYQAELDLVEPSLAHRAADRLARLGQRASGEWNHHTASSFLHRARALLPPDDPTSLALLPTLIANLGYLGDRKAAGELATEGIKLARAHGRPWLEARIWTEQQLMNSTDADVWAADATREELGAIISLFDRDGDAHGLAAAWLLAGRLELMLLRCVAMNACLQNAASYSRQVGDRGRARSALALLGWGYLIGPTPVPEAIHQCERLSDEAGENRVMSAATSGHIACLRAMLGDFVRAWALLDEVSATLAELGQTVGWVPSIAHREDVAFVANLQGDHERARRSLRRNHAELERAGATVLLSTQAALLADLAFGQGDIDLSSA